MLNSVLFLTLLCLVIVVVAMLSGAVMLRECYQYKKIINELVEAREAAEEASDIKSQFISSISHEIRTQLSSLVGTTRLLLQTELRPEQQKFVQTICHSSNTLLRISNDVLDFSIIESGQIKLEKQIFDLQKCVEASLKLVAPQATAKELELNYFIAPHTPNKLIGDDVRLSQILANLLSNAIKFTEFGEVVVSVTAQKQKSEARLQKERENFDSCNLSFDSFYEIQFAVKDTGTGIPSDQIDRLFKSFSQLDSSTTKQYGGTGLGLAICKQLAEMMGGRIWVETEVGFGSTFYFTVVVQSSIVQIETSQPEYTQAIPYLAEQLPLEILLAEDNVVNQQISLLILEQLGYRADAVSSGPEVMRSLCRQPYDVVLMDLQMPEMDGLTVARKIHQQWSKKTQIFNQVSSVWRTSLDANLPPPFPRPRIIAMTASASQEIWKQCEDAGMDGYISKPIKIEKLVQALKQCQQTPIDTKTLYLLRDLAGAKANEALAEIIVNYCVEVPQLLQAMRTAVATGDAVTLKQSAHKLRSASANLGATALAQLCKDLETMGNTGITNEALAYLLQAEATYKTVKAALQVELERVYRTI